MVTGKTKSGFSFCVKKRAIQNMELVETLAEMDGGNPLLIAKVIKMMLGEDQKKKLYDHVRDEEGYVSSDDVERELIEIFDTCGKELKNSVPSAG